jgi:hypothetical protein
MRRRRAQANERIDSPTAQGPTTDAGRVRRQTLTEAINFVGVCPRPSAVLNSFIFGTGIRQFGSPIVAWRSSPGGHEGEGRALSERKP